MKLGCSVTFYELQRSEIIGETNWSCWGPKLPQSHHSVINHQLVCLWISDQHRPTDDKKRNPTTSNQSMSSSNQGRRQQQPPLQSLVDTASTRQSTYSISCCYSCHWLMLLLVVFFFSQSSVTDCCCLMFLFFSQSSVPIFSGLNACAFRVFYSLTLDYMVEKRGIDESKTENLANLLYNRSTFLIRKWLSKQLCRFLAQSITLYTHNLLLVFEIFELQSIF